MAVGWLFCLDIVSARRAVIYLLYIQTAKLPLSMGEWHFYSIPIGALAVSQKA